jgi:cytochrome P450
LHSHSVTGRQAGIADTTRLFLRPLEALDLYAERRVNVLSVARPARPLHVVCEPATARAILTDATDRFEKGPGLRDLRPVLGRGLLTGDGMRALEERAQVRPLLTREAMVSYEGAVEQEIDGALARWSRQETVDITAATMDLSTRIALRCLFAANASRDELTTWSRALALTSRVATSRMRMPVHAPGWMPTRNNVRARAARRLVHEVVRRVIPSDGSVDVEMQSTLLFAATETTSSLLTAGLVALARDASLRDRLRQAIGGELATATHKPPLSATAFVHELLRLFPPVWVIPRRAREHVSIDGLRLKQGSDVLVAVYAIGRRDDLWSDPRRMDPARFLVGRPNRHAYLPFGEGPRACPGGDLAVETAARLVAHVLNRTDPVPRFAGRASLRAALTLKHVGPLMCGFDGQEPAPGRT